MALGEFGAMNVENIRFASFFCSLDDGLQFEVSKARTQIEFTKKKKKNRIILGPKSPY